MGPPSRSSVSAFGQSIIRRMDGRRNHMWFRSCSDTKDKRMWGKRVRECDETTICSCFSTSHLNRPKETYRRGRIWRSSRGINSLYQINLKYIDSRNDQVHFSLHELMQIFARVRKEIKKSFENEVRAVSNPGANLHIIAYFETENIKNSALYRIDMELCDGNLRISWKMIVDRVHRVFAPNRFGRLWKISLMDSRIYGKGKVHRDLKQEIVLTLLQDWRRHSTWGRLEGT